MRLHATHAKALLFSAFLLLLAAPSANAVDRAVLDSFGTPNGTKGGELIFAKGVAVNRSGVGAPAGSVYVAEANANHRISQFEADGDFIRTWGYDVIDGVAFPAAPNQNGTGFEICDVTKGNTAAQCKAGVTGAAAGQLANPQGIAIDQSTGYLYVTSIGNRRVDVFTGEGSFVGAFGWDVANIGDAGDTAPVNGFEVCTTVCKVAAAAGADAGRFSNLTPSYPAIDPNNPGRLYVPDQGNLRVNQFTVTAAADKLTAVSFDKAFGWDVIPASQPGDTGTGIESCTAASTCKAGSSGSGAGQFNSGGSPSAVALDSTGAIYVTSGPLTNGTCSAVVTATTGPCRVQKFVPDASSATNFGPIEGEGQLLFTSDTAQSVAPVNLAVDPSNDHLFVLRKESGTTYRIYEYASDGTYLGRHPGGEALETSGNTTATTSTGLAIGTGDRLYVNVAAGNLGQVFVLGPVPSPPSPVILPATEVTSTSAKLHGEVTVPAPGGPGFDTRYQFEYSSNGSKWTAVPLTPRSAGNVAGTYPVEQVVGGLEPNTEYAVRLAAATSSTVRSDVISVVTDADSPLIESVFSENLSSTEVLLGAEIDANHLATTYHFEWGTEEGVYPNRVPAFERPIGSGSSAIVVKEAVASLASETTYHFRVIATNAAGTTVTEDQQLFTLNTGGLPADRGIELVSPANKRPVGTVNKVEAPQLHFQASEDGNRFAFPILNALESTTVGGVVIYHSSRSKFGWSSTQVTPPSLVVSQLPGDNFSAAPGPVRYFSPDLGCALVQTQSPLTPDTPAVDVANGVTNLYRWSAADGSYTLITNRPPLNPTAPANSVSNFVYQVAGASPDCSKIYFRSLLYSFIPGATKVYEWDDGALRDAALRPDGSVAPGSPGQGVAVDRYTVPNSGERLFFVAMSNEAGDSGKAAVFVRKNPTETVNASKPAPGNLSPSLGAFYEAASPDGSRVFFVGNYGLTSTPSSGPIEACGPVGVGSDMAPAAEVNGAACTLYGYDVESSTLTDLAATTDPANPKGAMVQGVLDTSEDGSVVYFAARGQLIPGKGQTYLQNTGGSKFANVYRYEEGQLSYVDTVDDLALGFGGGQSVMVHKGEYWAAQTTRTGDHLLFASADNLDGKNPDHVTQTYLYSHETGTTVCISCPRDRDPVKPGEIVAQITTGQQISGGNHTPRSLSEDGRVFFMSRDPLVPGAIEGSGETSYNRTNERTNVYEWHRGQLSLLSAGRTRFIDMSADGSTAFVRSSEQLLPEDIDFAPDIYAYRIGSPGFAPPVPEIPCNPGADECQGTPTPPPVVPNPASAGFSGPGNPAPAAEQRQKAKKKKKKRKSKQRRQRKKAKSNRAANSNRGGAK